MERYRSWLRREAQVKLPKALWRKLDPSDLVQDCQYHAVRGIGGFQGRSGREFQGWMKGILVKRILARIRYWGRSRRRHGLERPLSDGGGLGGELAGDSSPIDETLVRGEDFQRLSFLLPLCRPDDRAVVVMRHLEDKSHDEIAASFGLTTEAARQRYCRAIQRIQNAATVLERMGEEGASSREQEVVLLHLLQGLEPPRIAEQLALPGELVGSWLARSRRHFPPKVKRSRHDR